MVEKANFIALFMASRPSVLAVLPWALLLYAALPATASEPSPAPVAAQSPAPETGPGVLAIPAPVEGVGPGQVVPSTEPPAGTDGVESLPANELESDALPLPPYPVELNPQVQRFLDLFQSEDKRGVIERWLHKSGRYLGMIRDVFRQKRLPEDLAYTAMIESGFNPLAVSRAGAKGLWQFTGSTGRRYGLKIDRWVDERLDPLKSSLAAADHLKDLFTQFGSWFLAQAAYNAGEVRVARAMQSSGSDDFWTIARGRLLREETKRFVPAIQAATLIAREPERYGFDVAPALPQPFEVAVVPFSLELGVIAAMGEIPPQALRELNPELLRDATPPGGSYSLKVPEGSGDRLRERLERLSASDEMRWTVHRVQRGESLQNLARAYRIAPRRVLEINRLSGSALRPGTEVVVPVLPAVRPRRDPGESVHVVRAGETLSEIARWHRVTLDQILRWNGLTRSTRIYPGDRLRVTESPGLSGAAQAERSRHDDEGSRQALRDPGHLPPRRGGREQRHDRGPQREHRGSGHPSPSHP